MAQLAILIDQESTVIRNACQLAGVPYVSIAKGYDPSLDQLIDELTAKVKALVQRTQETKQDVQL
jgi:hypothetical protein